MATALRLSVRTGVVGAWALMVGAVVLVLVDRLVSVVGEGPAGSPTMATVGLPIGAVVSSVLLGLYNGGSASVLVGIVLIAAGWYQLLALT